MMNIKQLKPKQNSRYKQGYIDPRTCKKLFEQMSADCGYKKQFLYSYKLVFDFTTDAGILEYLNHNEFTVDDVWFKREFYEGTLKRGEKK